MVRLSRRLVDWVSQNRADIARYGLPVVLFELFNTAYDHFGFLLGIQIWGPFTGPLIISATALVLNVIVFWGYDVMKIDWLQAKYLRDKADSGTQSKLERFLTEHRRAVLEGEPLWKRVRRFVLLSVVVDPVILAIHYRENYFTGVSIRDWLVLVAATTSACLLWAPLMEGVSLILHGIGYLLAWYFATPAF